jgi:hypothetical protein
VRKFSWPFQWQSPDKAEAVSFLETWHYITN